MIRGTVSSLFASREINEGWLPTVLRKNLHSRRVTILIVVEIATIFERANISGIKFFTRANRINHCGRGVFADNRASRGRVLRSNLILSFDAGKCRTERLLYHPTSE